MEKKKVKFIFFSDRIVVPEWNEKNKVQNVIETKGISFHVPSFIVIENEDILRFSPPVIVKKIFSSFNRFLTFTKVYKSKTHL
ncbi:MAG: hypothetical protein JXR03_18425 [Cyclobacteriaceae bacterium]